MNGSDAPAGVAQEDVSYEYARRYGRLSTNLGFLAGRLLRRALREAESALGELGLAAPPRYSLLELTVHSGGMSQRELARRLRVDPSGIVALVDELSGLGLIQRNPDPDDRRRVLITGTPAGRALADVASDRLEKAYRRLLEPLPAPEAAAFVRTLQLLTSDAPED